MAADGGDDKEAEDAGEDEQAEDAPGCTLAAVTATTSEVAPAAAVVASAAAVVAASSAGVSERDACRGEREQGQREESEAEPDHLAALEERDHHVAARLVRRQRNQPAGMKTAPRTSGPTTISQTSRRPPSRAPCGLSGS